MKNMLSNLWDKIKKNKEYFFVFFLYVLVTFVVYRYRLFDITTHYTMPDVDTDGGIWQYSMDFFKYGNVPNLEVNNLLSYPYGYSFTYTPVFSSIYLIFSLVVKFLGNGYHSVLAVMNLGTLLNYPLTGIFTYACIRFFVKNKYASFLGSLAFTFSFHNILYARNLLSYNHVWVIPLYYLYFFKYWENQNSKNLILSGLALAFSFSVFSYWAFYSVLLSPFFYFTKKNVTIPNIINLFKYYVLTGFIMVLLNLNYLISTFQLLSVKTNVDLGRGFEPLNQLTCVLCMFSTRYNINSSEWFIQHGVWMGYIPLFSLVVCLAFLYKKNKIIPPLSSGFLLCVSLATYIPGFFWFNEIYFKIFHMFKSVSRMNVLASFFLSFITAVTVSFLLNRYLSRKIYMVIITLILSLFMIYENINDDPTFYHRTNFDNIVDLYTPIKNNSNIKVIAGYPMALTGMSSKKYGVPPMYELLGQSVHKKPLAGGADPSDKASYERWYKIENLMATSTIKELADRNIDTIIIYNQIMQNPEEVHEFLLNNENIVYVDSYISKIDDPVYLSANDLSRDISVYQIKSVVEKNKNSKNTLNIENASYKKDLEGYGYFKLGSKISSLFLFFCLLYLAKYYIQRLLIRKFD